MLYLGIDPGSASGAICVLGREAADEELHRMPPSIPEIADLLIEIKNRAIPHGGAIYAYLELVHSYPLQGVVGVFSFGENYGALQGILAAIGIPYRLVEPRWWTHTLGVPVVAEKKERKAGREALARKILPHSDLGISKLTADAVLLAILCRKLTKGGGA